MIVNIGKRIHVEISGFRFTCDCQTPGRVSVVSDRGDESITLPGNPDEARRFVVAYLRAVDEPIDYVSSDSESSKPSLALVRSVCTCDGSGTVVVNGAPQSCACERAQESGVER